MNCKYDKINLFSQLNTDVSTFQRKFVSEVRRHDELERKLRYIAAEMTRDGFSIPDAPDGTKVPNPRESIDLEVIKSKIKNQLPSQKHEWVK